MLHSPEKLVCPIIENRNQLVGIVPGVFLARKYRPRWKKSLASATHLDEDKTLN